MTQPRLTDRLAARFRAQPSKWIDGRGLAQIAGAYAWRSRVSDLRRAPYAMRIENRWETVTEPSGQRYRVSWYRYVPEAPCE